MCFVRNIIHLYSIGNNVKHMIILLLIQYFGQRPLFVLSMVEQRLCNWYWSACFFLIKATREGSDQTAHMCRLIWGFAGRTNHIVGNLMSQLICVLLESLGSLCWCWNGLTTPWIYNKDKVSVFLFAAFVKTWILHLGWFPRDYRAVVHEENWAKYPFKRKLYCHRLITFAKGLEPDQARQSVGPDLDPNCLTLMVFLKRMFWK